MKKLLSILVFSSFCSSLFCSKPHLLHDTDSSKTKHCPTTTGMKTWWFFGYESTSKEGIRADVRALKDAGFSGIVYYDQNHAKGDNGAEDGFSKLWWENMKYALSEAHKAGLTVEMNISNGYVAGGKWIDAAHAMQRVAYAEEYVTGGKRIALAKPSIQGKEHYVRDIAILAFPKFHDGKMRHITATYRPRGKGRSGAMQTPMDSVSARGEFSGAKFVSLPDIGVLQASDDSLHWRDVVRINPMYNSQGSYPVRTNAFPETKAKYWRIDYLGKERLKEWKVGCSPKIDRWEEKAALHSDFTETEMTPDYAHVIQSKDIIDLSAMVKGDSIVWDAPQGEWTILWLAAVITGAKSKHGRNNLLGYECDKLSKEAAELHWNSYMQVILDSLRHSGIDYVEGVTMDSHEGGSQNWTPLMIGEFRKRRGYDLRPYLPVLAGYIVESRDKTVKMLRDYRHTINDCMRENYYGTFQKLAKQNHLTLTAQAIGNALCITGDAISVKKAIEKPQGEFWTYQQNGAYDVKDCSSAAHLYGKPIASAEAMTDATYSNTPYELKRVADIAFSLGAQEMVVCATPHVPYEKCDTPYISGREYAINRTNPHWNELKPMWLSINRTFPFVQSGKADPDVLVYLGDELPMKILTHRLPHGIERMDWDACTGDALRTRLEPDRNGHLCTPDGVEYKALVIAKDAYISPESQLVIERFRKSGVRIQNDLNGIRPGIEITLSDGSAADGWIVHTQRKLSDSEIFFIANIDRNPHSIFITINGTGEKAKFSVYRTATGTWRKLKPTSSTTLSLTLDAAESVIIKKLGMKVNTHKDEFRR